MENTLRPLFVATALAVAAAVSAQGGIRLIVWSYEPFFAGSQGELTHVGVGYDHDLNDRLSLGVQARYVVTGEGWVVNYRSAFHFADTKNSSFYMGPMVGLRSVAADDPVMLIPLAFRMGVRGGLERFYADLHAEVVYNVGGGTRVHIAEDGLVADLRTGSFCIGLDMGWGWKRETDR